MFRALLLSLLLASPALAQDSVTFTLANNNELLIVTVNGDGTRKLTFDGQWLSGGTCFVHQTSTTYNIPTTVQEISINVVNRSTQNGLEVDYLDFVSGTWEFNINGSDDATSTDTFRTGLGDDVINAYGGTNLVASGRGDDYINVYDTTADSYLFTGEGGVFGDGWDYVTWLGTCVVYTANNTQPPFNEPDFITNSTGAGITVHHTGPLYGWN